MTFERLQRRLPVLLDEVGRDAAPDYIDHILSQTETMRQRPGWTFPERWLPMDITVQTPVGLRQVPWRTIGIAALLLVLLAVAAALIGSRQIRPAPLFGPAANGSIAFESDGDILVANADGSEQRVLIGGQTHDVSPVFSLDGRTIFFGREGDDGTTVMAADADGGNVRPLSTARIGDSESPAVSPDGSQLAILTFDGAVGTLTVFSLSGDNAVTQIDTGAIEPARTVAWRPPAAEELIFLGHPDGDRSALGLYAISVDGTGLREIGLQRGESLADDPAPTQVSFQGLTVSDDGQHAAYWSWETEVVPGIPCFSHIVDLNTAVDRRLELQERGCVDPTFLPDGRVLVRGGRASSPDSEWSGLYVADPATGVGSRIGPTYMWPTEVGWVLAPDQEHVLLMLTMGSYLVPLDGGPARATEVNFPGGTTWQRLALP